MTDNQLAAQEELETYKDLKLSIQRYQQQVDELETQIQRCTARTDACMAVRYLDDGTKEMVPIITANRPQSNQELFLVMNIDKRNDLWLMAIQQEEKCREIEQRIKAWTTRVECEILSRFYLMGMTYDQIHIQLSTTCFSYSYSSIRRYRDAGLEHYGEHLTEKMSRNEQLEAVSM